MEANNQIQISQKYELVDGNSMMNLGNQLADFIKAKGLSQQIQGREYVNVEGWQYAGGMLGVLPIITEVQDISTEGEIIFQAACELYNIHTGSKVGGGFAMCSNKEKGKKFFEAFAIQSMAQTRSIGKAYRLMIGWLMKAAGYEGTPAEEMDTVKETENEIKNAAIEYLQSENREQALAVWNKYPQYKKHPIFVRAAQAMSALYPKELEPANVTEAVVSDKQVDLIRNLVNSHHIPEKTKEHIALALEHTISAPQASTLIQDLEKFIREGIEFEKNTPATEEQVEIIEMLLENDAFKPEEMEKGKEKLKKGYSIAQAQKVIDSLEKELQKRGKEQPV